MWECAFKGKSGQEINKVLDQISDWLLTDNNSENSEGSVNGTKTGNV